MSNDVEVKITVDDKQASQAFKRLGKESSDFTSNFTSGISGAISSYNVFQGAVAANIVTSAFAKLKAAFGEAIDESIRFKRAQLEIETILPQGTRLTSELVGQLEKLAKQYGTSASSQAKAYYEIISAGVNDAADGAKLLSRANELATGGVSDTAKTIDLLTTIYNVYGKEVATSSEAMDSLFKTVQIGKTTIAELSSDLGQALPIAKSFGIGLDEVGAVLAQFTNAGIKTSEAVTMLNALLSAIAKNGKELGPTMNSTAVQTDGLGTVIQRLMDKTKGSNDALFELLGRQEAVRSVQSLSAKGLEGYNKTLGEYSNKAGVASEASKKILENDLGKQFDILKTNIAESARSFIDLFVPATLSATKAINTFFEGANIDPEQASRGIDQVRAKINQVKESFEAGRISSDAYKRTMGQLTEELAMLSSKLDTAEKPLVLLSTAVEREIENIKSQIGSMQNGFDNLQLGPIERQLKVDELNAKLEIAQKKLAELTKVKPDLANPVSSPREKSAIENEFKINEDLKAMRIQFDAEERAFKEQKKAIDQTDIFERKQIEIDSTFELEKTKLEATANAEIAKTKFIKDEEEQRASIKKIQGDADLKFLKLQNKKELDERENNKKKKESIDKGTLEATGNFIQAGILLAQEGSALQKGLMITQAIMNTYAAANRALLDYPFPASVAVASSVVALGLANVAKISGAKFEQGGFVPGLPQYGDQVIARLNPGEAVLNNQQQKQFMDMANGRGQAEGGSIAELVSAIKNQVISISIDGREIARTIRDQKLSGYAI